METRNSDPAQEALDALRRLPSLDAVLRRHSAAALPRPVLARVARGLLDELREQVRAGRLGAKAVEELSAGDRLDTLLAERCRAELTPRHRRVFNATGVVLHTGLGRAPLADAAVQAVAEAARYAVVEVDPISARRNQREEAVAALLTALTGAGGALVVNNCAAAVTLALRALAQDRAVVVSRGELVEIGGGFRMPEVMAQAGCRMVEVGTTNRTHLRDYERAIDADTALLLKVHPSNFRVTGFTSTPELHELAALARARGILALDDQGSGYLLAEPLPGLAGEPTVPASLGSGVHLVAFSGDKLLGGPQCGVLLGEADLVARVRAHPLYRALRCDKLALAALEATLRVYRDGEPLRDIPTLRALAAAPGALRAVAEDLQRRIAVPAAEVIASESFAGSGANPARPLPSFAVALPGGEALCAQLRCSAIPVFARIAADRVLLDARTLLLEDLEAVAQSVREALRTPVPTSPGTDASTGPRCDSSDATSD
ncbi:MAG: L-seryl-tRNA(Sec) selenium transferase [Planctomycetes bacterium]|nr:L-seryl-tRNA(Sec) selenium transferase [Planctomycetota bacterium]